MAYARLILIILLITPFSSTILKAQSTPSPVADEITITLDEAIQIALVNNYMLRKGALDIDMANAQIREAWGTVYPQIGGAGSYQRNIKSPNPFAGSDAGGIFQVFGALEWLGYNERARTDGNPATNPITFDEFLDRQEQGYQDAGITLPSMDDNPFAVDNQFQFGISVTQALYNGAAFAAIRGAEQWRSISNDQLETDRQTVTELIKSSFYTALLAIEQAEVMRKSVERLRKTVADTRASAEAGFLSRQERLGVEVELVNFETNLLQVENQAELAVKNLSLQLGIPVRTKVNLRGSLEVNDEMMIPLLSTDEVYEIAMQQRPDIRQVEGFVNLMDINRRLTRARYVPVVNAFANAAYIGQVPDNRLSIRAVEGQDFTYTSSTRGFFDDSYWNSSLAVGIQLNWSIFNGFQTRSRVQQNTIDIRKAEIDEEMLKNAVYLEIDQAIRQLENAHKRIMSQERNKEQAQLNYEYALTRLREGVGTPLEERQASALLDQSRLNYLSAVYDYLIAVNKYEKAIGIQVYASQN
jgi:outer membrane protein TolC